MLNIDVISLLVVILSLILGYTVFFLLRFGRDSKELALAKLLACACIVLLGIYAGLFMRAAADKFTDSQDVAVYSPVPSSTPDKLMYYDSNGKIKNVDMYKVRTIVETGGRSRIELRKMFSENHRWYAYRYFYFVGEKTTTH